MFAIRFRSQTPAAPRPGPFRGRAPEATDLTGRHARKSVRAARGWALALAVGLGLVVPACGGGGDGGSPKPTLESTCTQICNNVLGQCCDNLPGPCASPSSAQSNCLQGCQSLNVVAGTCIDEFASYLACLSGATSLSCNSSGPTVTILSPSCNNQLQAYGNCGGTPSPVSACIGVTSANSPCGSSIPGPVSLFCVGQPVGCTPAGPGLFGIGPYCCPQGQ